MNSLKPLSKPARNFRGQKARGSDGHRTASGRDRLATFALAMIAATGVQLLRMQGTSEIVWLSLEFAAVLSACWFAWFRIKESIQHQGWIIVGAACVCLPFATSLILVRIFGRAGEATELVWLAMLQNAALWQSAIAWSRRQEWMSFLLSSFLMVFGLATSDRRGMVAIVLVYALFAVWWLTGKYWKSIERGFIARDSVPLVRLRLTALAFAVLLTCAIGGLAISSGTKLSAIDGFMPTSGGNGQSDPSARNGVGDGDMLVAAKEEAFTFGPVESELFMDSKTPSLYDLANDFYGEPFVRREHTRTISLDSQSKESELEGSESKKRSREFSAIRMPREGTGEKKMNGTESKAVFHLIGRVPQHLRLETFDSFDGVKWSRSDDLLLKESMQPIALETMQSKPWMRLQVHAAELAHPVRERQTVKVIGLKSQRIVTPSLLTHMYIDKVDNADFFGWTIDGQLMMPDRDHVPQLSVVHQMYQTPQLHPLRDPNNKLHRIAHTNQQLADSEDSGVAKYLHEYSQSTSALANRTREVIERHLGHSAAGLTDWQRIEAILDYLRSNFRHQPNATVPTECEDAVQHLFDCKQGPDYLFASAAAVMIRNLGVPSRLVSGFYASPDHYDFKSGQTEVLPEHMHTWTEVYCHGIWFAIEPTPGFASPNEFRTWNQWAITRIWAVRDTIYYYPLRCVLCCLSVVAIAVFRRRIADAALSATVIWLALAPARIQIGWMRRLLEWRGWIHGRNYALRSTLGQRLSSMLNENVGLNARDRELYIQAANRIAYAPRSKTIGWLNDHSVDLRKICWAIIKRGLVNLFAMPKMYSRMGPLSRPSTRSGQWSQTATSNSQPAARV